MKLGKLIRRDLGQEVIVEIIKNNFVISSSSRDSITLIIYIPKIFRVCHFVEDYRALENIRTIKKLLYDYR